MNSCLTIAILVALPIEARSLTSQKLAVGQTVSLTDDLILHISGIGAHRARAGAMHALGIGAGALVSWGTAAGLDRLRASWTAYPAQPDYRSGAANFYRGQSVA